jgi:phage gp16-like protein
MSINTPKWIAPRIARLEAELRAYEGSAPYADSATARIRDEQRIKELNLLMQALRKEATADPAQRKKDLARIHYLKKQALVDDETHRSVCHRITGCGSSGEMTRAERLAVIDHYTRASAPDRAAQSSRRYESRPNVGRDRDELMRKVEALLAEKRRIEQVPYISWRYADGIAKRLAGVESIKWADAQGLQKVIAALALHVKRLEIKAQGGIKK